MMPGGASWLFRYERDGVERWAGLGSLSDFSLKEACARARAKRQMLADGIDPLKQKRDDKAAKSLADARSINFESAARRYFAEHKAKWRSDKHRNQFINSLEMYAFKPIGHLAVAEIGKAEVLKVLEQDKSGQRFWDSRRVTADRVRSRIESVLNWCNGRGYRTGANPAMWKGSIKEVLPSRDKKDVKNHPALDYSEIGRFMIDLRKRKDVAAKALAFTILTAARSGETLGMRWDEWEGDIWTVPAGRIKAGMEHRVPLSKAALAILQALPRDHDRVFAIVDDDAMGILMKSMAYSSTTPNLDSAGKPDGTFALAVVHGMRATFGTWAEDCTGYPDGVREACLAHKYKTETVASYQRGEKLDKRRHLMNDWAGYCATTAPAPSAKVIPIKKRK